MTQEKKNRLLAFTLTALVLIIAALIIYRTGDYSSEVDRAMFQVGDLKTIDRVVLEQQGSKVELKYEHYRWRVNDRFEADRSLIEVLFATLKQVEAKRRVAESIRDSVADQLSQRGVKIGLFSGDEKRKVILAGGNEQKTLAYFMEEGARDPFVVVIPGYRVYVPGIFELDENGWKDKLVFSFNWQNFATLEATYRNPSGNFTVEMERNQVSIKNVDADTAKLNTYLDQVSLLTVEQYIDNTGMTDSLTTQTPVMKLVISDIATRNYTLEVFATERELYGRINSASWAVLSKNKIIPLLRPKEFFVRR
jgi:hypothetical protein